MCTVSKTNVTVFVSGVVFLDELPSSVKYSFTLVVKNVKSNVMLLLKCCQQYVMYCSSKRKQRLGHFGVTSLF